MTINSADIVAYAYQGGNYHPECLIGTLAGVSPLHEFWLKVGAESMLTAEARTLGLDRSDESGFDSANFPKVVLLDQVLEGERCFRCGQDLVEISPNPWRHATEETDA